MVEQTNRKVADDYWSARARKFGHTGWADQGVHAYDRLERLASIKATISTLPKVSGRTALDFGCGTGDFSKLLLSSDYAVCGYDPFVKPAIDSAKFRYASSYAEIPRNHDRDIVLSITVLDHILDRDSVREALRTIASCLKPQGTFLMLEYALDSAEDREKRGLGNDYQSFRTLREWESLLVDCSLRIADVAPAAHSRFNPSEGYTRYARSPLVRVRRFLPNGPLVRAWYDPMLRRMAAGIMKEFPYSPPGPSILKLLRCHLQ